MTVNRAGQRLVEQVPDVEGRACRGDGELGFAAPAVVIERGQIGADVPRPAESKRAGVAGEHLELARDGEPGERGLVAELEDRFVGRVGGVVRARHEGAEGRSGLGEILCERGGRLDDLAEQNVAGGLTGDGVAGEGVPVLGGEQGGKGEGRRGEGGAGGEIVAKRKVGRACGAGDGGCSDRVAVIEKGDGASGVRWKAESGSRDGLAVERDAVVGRDTEAGEAIWY